MIRKILFRLGYAQVSCASCGIKQGWKRIRGLYFVCDDCLVKAFGMPSKELASLVSKGEL